MDMVWDEERNCAVNNKFGETSNFQQDEELPGFVFDEEVLEELHRGIERPVMPEDNDSVSTF